jgi:tRNA (uracil-5-)-methyltransferase
METQYKITKAREGQKRRKLQVDKAREKASWPDGNSEDVLDFETDELLAKLRLDDHCSKNHLGVTTLKPEDGKGSDEGDFHEVVLEVEELSSTGDGLASAATKDHVFVIPFALPGEQVLAKVRKRVIKAWSVGDLIKVLRPSTKREGVTPRCKYFTTCSGCQLQMIPYEDQLAHKRTIYEKAFKHFSGLSPAQIPAVIETGCSPKQYGYRTKLTPHFDGPVRKNGTRRFASVPPIGFHQKNIKTVVDIEACPIGTGILQEGLTRERANVAANISSYKNGSTILLREHTDRQWHSEKKQKEAPSFSLHELPTPFSQSHSTKSDGTPELGLSYPTLGFTDLKTYVNKNTSLSSEYIGSYKFTSSAGGFFQNNNSILPSFLSYIYGQALPKQPKHDSFTKKVEVKYLLDAYSGSGLFALTLSPLFSSVLGIEIDRRSVEAARQNAKVNNVSNAGFIEADASDLFADVPYPCDQTALVIDPPRKGCSKDFLRQMLKYGPRRVVYVSCNVHSQARDVGVLVRGGFDGEESGRWRYEIESLKGWDFFPQTGHVEGVCVLNRVDSDWETGRMEGRGKLAKEGEQIGAQDVDEEDKGTKRKYEASPNRG